MECSITGCGRTVMARELCRPHLVRWYRTGEAGEAEIRRYRKDEVCTVEGCERKHCAKGLCRTHYIRLMKTGDAGQAQIRTYTKRGQS